MYVQAELDMEVLALPFQ